MSIETIKTLVNDDSVHNHLANLRDRWQDEREYEDWKDYEDSMISALASHPLITLIRSTKRPFGMVVTVHCDEYAAPWKVYLKRKGRYEVLSAQRMAWVLPELRKLLPLRPGDPPIRSDPIRRRER